MLTIHSQINQFRGSHYEFGHKQGLELRDSPILQTRHKYWKLKRPRFEIDVNEAKTAFIKFAPNLWDEFEGLADGSGQHLKDVLRDFGGYRMEPERSGCTVFVKDNFLVRNYDFQPVTYDGRYMLYQPSDGGYASIGPSSRVTGRMDGMNEHGLAIGYNFTHRKKTKDGFVCYMISRMILELCKNVDEAVQLIKEIPHRNSFSYIVLDQEGNSHIIEASPRRVTVRQASGCTNHFEIQQEENRHYLHDSVERLEKLNEKDSTIQSKEQAFQLFNSTDGGIFSKNYKSWSGTIHTSLYEPENLKAWIALGGDNKQTSFDFKKWLAGEDLSEITLQGKIDTTIPIANMHF